MDKAVKQAADRLAGIVLAFMYPAEMIPPSFSECESALRAYDDALEAAFNRLAPRDHECKPRISPGLKTRR